MVVLIALSAGPFLTSALVPDHAAETSSSDPVAWPTLQACSIQFGDSPYRLSRETITGSDEALIDHLKSRCRAVLEGNAVPSADPSAEELALIERVSAQTPLMQRAGHWRIFKGTRLKGVEGLPLVFGIRDHCPAGMVEADDREGTRSRVVVWAIAIAGKDSHWTSYVATSQNELAGLSELIPNQSKRTLAISDSAGPSVIGFSGGDFESAIAYYKQLADRHSWILESRMTSQGKSWSATIKPGSKTEIKAVHIQLSANHNAPMSGILKIQFDRRSIAKSGDRRSTPVHAIANRTRHLDE